MCEILHHKYPITSDEFNHRYWELGQSMEQIACDLNGWGGELRRHVLKAGLRLKTKRQAYDDRMRTNANRKHFFNQEFFDSWSPASAWVVGLIASDGCIHNRLQSWAITMADRDCLKQVAELIDYEGPISKATHTTCYILRVGSTFMVRRLLEIGLTPAKSLTLKYPELPDNMHRHFIRGYFDGDGCISIQKPRSKKTNLYTARVTFSTGSPDFANSLIDVLNDIGIEAELRIRKSGIRNFGDRASKCAAGYDVRVGGYYAKQLFEYFYEGIPDNLSMARKRIKYQEWYDVNAPVYTYGPALKGHNAVSPDQIPLF